MIDTRKDTGYSVRALVQQPSGKNALAYGSMIRWKDYMAVWAKILNLPGGYYRQGTIDEADGVAPGGLGREVGERWAYLGEFGYDGGDPTVVNAKDVSIMDDRNLFVRLGSKGANACLSAWHGHLVD